MLTVISPAKTLDFDTPIRTRRDSDPQFLAEAGELAAIMKTKGPRQLGKLMGISDKLANLNAERYRDWSEGNTPLNSRQALYAFMGDVYAGLNAQSLAANDVSFAQKRLRILSGLYGLLRPLDRIQPYRLEMGTSLKNPGGRDLYAFWQEQVTGALNEQARELRTRYLVNLASNEYFRAIDEDALEPEVITPVFKDGKNGDYRILSFFAKKARGMMARHIIRQRLRRPEGMRDFNDEGYRYNEALSTDDTYVFTRDRN